MKPSHKKFLLFAVAISFTALWTTIAKADISSTCRSGGGGHCVELAAVIPGLEFIQYDTSGGFGGFISSLYIFGLGLVGVSALLMLVYGAFLYMTAGDNESRTSSAKGKIRNAFLGLAIAFLSWLILRTINPQLVSTLDVSVPKITGVGTQAPPPAAPPSQTPKSVAAPENQVVPGQAPIFNGQSGRVLTGTPQENAVNSAPGDIIVPKNKPLGTYLYE